MNDDDADAADFTDNMITVSLSYIYNGLCS